MNGSTKKPKTCSFCGNAQTPQRRIIQGPNAAICEECVNFSFNFFQISEKPNSFNYQDYSAPPSPEKIKQYLEQYVIGQEYAKKVISVAAYNHYMRIYHNNRISEHIRKGLVKEDEDPIHIEKSNVLLIGPTGSGKTLLAKTLASLLQVPFAITDATSLTEAGYVGEDVENILLKLYQSANGDIGKASHGIIFIDEIDKITRKSKNVSITRDVSGEGVQHALLKIIEGTVASIPPQGGRKHPHQQMIRLDTSNILFICSGAFVGLEEIVQSRLYESNMGFGNTDINRSPELERSTLLSKIHPDDLINYGLVPELVGRIPIVASLDDHSIQSLYRILNEPKNSIIKQMKAVFSYNNIELVIEEEAQMAIATMAYKQKIGARGIRSIIENILLDLMFFSPSQSDIAKITITRECVEQNANPIIGYTGMGSVANN